MPCATESKRMVPIYIQLTLGCSDLSVLQEAMQRLSYTLSFSAQEQMRWLESCRQPKELPETQWSSSLMVFRGSEDLNKTISLASHELVFLWGMTDGKLSYRLNITSWRDCFKMESSVL